MPHREAPAPLTVVTGHGAPHTTLQSIRENNNSPSSLTPLPVSADDNGAAHVVHRPSASSNPNAGGGTTSARSSASHHPAGDPRASSTTTARLSLLSGPNSPLSLITDGTEGDEEDDKDAWKRYDPHYMSSPEDDSATLAKSMMHGMSLSPDNTARRRVSVIQRATMIHALMSENKTFLMVMFSKAMKRYVDGKLSKTTFAFEMLRQNVSMKQKEERAAKMKHVHNESRRVLQQSTGHGQRRSEAAVKVIMDWMVTSKIFPADIPPAMLKTICMGMENKNLKKNEVLFLQGDPGDRFYIIMEGKVQLAIQDNKEEEVRLRIKRDADPEALNRQDWASSNGGGIGKFLKILNQGIAFGELSLMDETARTTSCICCSDEAQLCVIDQALYNRTLRNFHKTRATTKDLFNRLSGWPTFKKWVPELRQNLADSGVMRTFNRGMIICHKGAPLEYLYVVVDGTVTAMGDISDRHKKKKHKKKKNPSGRRNSAMEGGINETVTINANTGERESFENTSKRNKAGDYAVLSTVTDGSLLGDVEAFLGLKKHCVDQVVSSALCNVYEVKVDDFMSLVKFSKPVMQDMKETAIQRMEWHVHRWKTERGIRRKKMKLLAQIETAKQSSLSLPTITNSSAEMSILDKLRLEMRITEADKRNYKDMKDSGGYISDDDNSSVASFGSMNSFVGSVAGSVGPYGASTFSVGGGGGGGSEYGSPARYPPDARGAPMSERKMPASFVITHGHLPGMERSKSMNDLTLPSLNGGRVGGGLSVLLQDADSTVPTSSFSGSSISLRTTQGENIGQSLRALVFVKHTLPKGTVLSKDALEYRPKIQLKPVSGFVHGMKR